ncbi:MerR family transcriptional regulator [Variovorax sp. DT-64]|uniref:MerR family transcriptional regulator n=1 Tax=Variovorax sp. DT-64 TaxID=3396160 RepID=UPI003F19BA67
MRISELARRAGVTVHALRHYERLGLLLPARNASGYRDYPESMRREVVFIAMARRIGFSLPAIGELLPAYRAGRLSITRMTDALEERAAALDQEIARLQALRAQVIEHADWLRAERREQRAGTESKKAKQAPWPGAKEKRR